MGRSILITVILISSIYAGIVLNVQRQLYKMPEVMVDNYIRKESENVSDYALRTAIKDAYLISPPQSGLMEITKYYNMQIHNNTLDSIHFRVAAPTGNNQPPKFQAFTYVTGLLQGKEIKYKAEIAFTFPALYTLIGPDLCYTISLPQANHGHDYAIPDTTSHGNNAYVLLSNMTYQVSGGPEIKTTTSGLNSENETGLDKKCLAFDGISDAIICPDTPFLQLSGAFTLSVFAKVHQASTRGTLYWLASNSTSETLKNKPTAGIWYTPGFINFGCTTVNTVADSNFVQLAVPYTADWGTTGQFKDAPWHHFAMSVEFVKHPTGNTWRCVLKGYKDGVYMGQTVTGYGNNNTSTLVNTEGIVWGCRYIRTAGTTAADRRYYWGLLDNIGLYKRVLTAEQIQDIYNDSISPAEISYIKD
jgi:hypothetical protein